jgi:hypothetical protein
MAYDNLITAAHDATRARPREGTMFDRCSLHAFATASLMLALVLGWNTGFAEAQSSSSAQGPGNLAVRLIKAGPDDAQDRSLLPVSRAECEAGTLTVHVDGLPDGDSFPNLEAWLATGNGNCNQADRESRSTTSGTSLNCTKLELKNSVRLSSVAELEVELGPACESEGAWTLYILAMRGEEPQTAAVFYGTLSFDVDVTAPDAPRELHGGTGSSAIPLAWTPSPGIERYIILFDENAKQREDGSCGSELLQEGASIAVEDFRAGMSIQVNGRSVSSAEVDGLYVLGGAGTLGAAIIAVDRAGNMSRLSQVVCLSVVDLERCPHNGT